ncbi:3-phosphoshikimate 1-carboxyvinyltransferase [Prevotella sp. HUN102]|uniref:3-phosphoshikimate 1-carboxyvinyltransferase n=1 Tax=Prevotella sp. HUN102 TaxID=1392486 RepID=UPI000491E2EF|nr:3-phosphoshikimate 1-carboxyvinyltransferase [Prevotella sp. HUN102]
MHYIIKAPSHIDSRITLPASKSISNRALIIQALTGGQLFPVNLSDCDDTEVIISALKNNPETINLKASGTAMRFMTAYLSVTEGEHILTGTERMRHRPIKILVDALRFLGAEIEYMGEEGFPPLRIRGKELEGGNLEISGSVSSQYISALLMIAPVLKKGLKLKLLGEIISRPYIDLTLHLMHQYGVEVDWTDVDTITIAPQKYKECNYVVENDWTASSYWYEILTLLQDGESKIVFPGLLNGSRQGDSAVKYIFSLLGIKTTHAVQDKLADVTLVAKRRMLTKLEYDFSYQPDLAQTLIALCPILNIPFKFTGLSTLKIKETDRITAMKNEMAKLGYVIYDENDSEMSWDGERCEPLANPIIETYEDHRMAMSFAPLAVSLGEIRINNPQVVSKSYPHFWDELQRVGFRIEAKE